jgi:hypothetical protein
MEQSVEEGGDHPKELIKQHSVIQEYEELMDHLSNQSVERLL